MSQAKVSHCKLKLPTDTNHLNPILIASLMNSYLFVCSDLSNEILQLLSAPRPPCNGSASPPERLAPQSENHWATLSLMICEASKESNAIWMSPSWTSADGVFVPYFQTAGGNYVLFLIKHKMLICCSARSFVVKFCWMLRIFNKGTRKSPFDN